MSVNQKLTDSFFTRTLTKHQRQLLEEYAADVEKRTPGSQPNTESSKEPLSGDNGKVYFNSERSSLPTWLSLGWQMLRDRLKF